MDKNQLDGLLALKLVADKRNFTAAAQALRVSPSAISKMIRQLETRLGVTLLTRTTRTTSLTEAGERFLSQAGPALELILAAMEDAGSLAEKPAGRLRLNAPQMIYPKFLKQAVQITTRNGLDARLFATSASVRSSRSISSAIPSCRPERTAAYTQCSSSYSSARRNRAWRLAARSASAYCRLSRRVALRARAAGLLSSTSSGEWGATSGRFKGSLAARIAGTRSHRIGLKRQVRTPGVWSRTILIRPLCGSVRSIRYSIGDSSRRLNWLTPN